METCTSPPFAPTLLSFAKDSRLVCQQLLHSLWALLNRHPNEAAKTLSPRQNIPALCSRARLGVSPSFAPPPVAMLCRRRSSMSTYSPFCIRATIHAGTGGKLSPALFSSSLLFRSELATPPIGPFVSGSLQPTAASPLPSAYRRCRSAMT